MVGPPVGEDSDPGKAGIIACEFKWRPAAFEHEPLIAVRFPRNKLTSIAKPATLD
jgi:hypothetical protein